MIKGAKEIICDLKQDESFQVQAKQIQQAL